VQIDMMSHMRQRDAQERRLILLICGTSARRRARQDEISRLAGEVDGRRLVDLLVRTRLLVLVGGRLRELGLTGIAELERELDSFKAPAQRWGVVSELASLEVLGRLETAGIRAIPLKGSTLARQLYGDIAARTSIDLDILVAPGDLTGAIAAVEELGWRWLSDVPRTGGLPLLHETLIHPSLPRVELHWRVHWYERRFAADAVARAVKPAGDAPLEMEPMDGLIALMLFYARDGFAGLRYPADAAAWWDAKCAGSAGPRAAEVVADLYPGLAAPVSVASSLLAGLAGVPIERPHDLSFRWRVAAGLATPFLEGGRSQVEANAGLTDVLLAPRSAAGDAIRRVMRNMPVDPAGPPSSSPPPWRTLLGHMLRVARRWALAFGPAIVRGYAVPPRP
jgi:hypothetical protein